MVTRFHFQHFLQLPIQVIHDGVTISGDIAISTSKDKTMIVWNWQTGPALTTRMLDTTQPAITQDWTILSGDQTGRVYFLKPNNALRGLLGIS